MKQLIHQHHDLIIGTASGATAGVSFLPSAADITHTVILAVVGAITGLLTTVCFKFLKHKIKQHNGKHQ